ncbi:chemotaxis protein CheB [Dyadobacter frigoris]|uniref:protein-glutamate methylesterase n=1 Tax=Dyadobacter frigoris TaxID=2576211 RepID=A0A4U6CV90_9BACT|nr:chemotaxis protein CheB [Dyadobacter frigoris]TKT88669.1 chemotaxis protein CheB [Dyadobacter frigoris]GLU53852.1 putative chemotaxis protein-glutamate methylesterase [Dyadobacter frigoris]
MEENDVKSKYKAIVIGGSAGSLSVLFEVFPALNPVLNVAIILVLHRKYSGDSSLSDLLSTKTLIPTKEIDDKDPILPGNIYLAPADYHLLIEKNYSFSLDVSEKINFSRPSLDVTFESAADTFGTSLIAILLSGSNDDGTAGLKTVKDAGGFIIAQKPESAQMAYMPQNAINNLEMDLILDSKGISDFINMLH